MIYDTDDNRILSTGFAIRTDEVKTATIQIDCTDGYFLRGEAVADLVVEARHDGDAFVNIETTPIALAPWDGDREIFEVRVTAGTILTHSVRAFTLSVGR